MPLAMASAAPMALERFCGPHQRSLHYANWVLKMTALLVALSGALWWGY